tara:strand:- start:503 stop:1114 length:612 start_codon:yes stop_codon:yes gene_type:complete
MSIQILLEDGRIHHVLLRGLSELAGEGALWGKVFTQKQAFVVGNLYRQIRNSRDQQKDLEKRFASAKEAFVLGNALRQERGLTEDQETEWEYPCGKIRLEQLNDAIDSLRCEITNFDTDIRQITDQLQSYIDSVSLPVAVPASEAPNAGDEDVGPPCSTCCPGGQQDDSDSSSSDDEDEDVEGRAEWIKFNTFTSDEEDGDEQ